MQQVIHAPNGAAIVIEIASECRHLFREPLAPWGDNGTPGVSDPRQRTGVFRVTSAIAVLDRALAKLGKRETPARARLATQRDALAASLEALSAASGVPVDELGAQRKFEPRGERFLSLVSKYEAAYSAQVQAEAAKNAATRDTVLARRADLDVCEADTREALREIHALLASIKARRWPKTSRRLSRVRKRLARSWYGYRVSPSQLAQCLRRCARAPRSRQWLSFGPATSPRKTSRATCSRGGVGLTRKSTREGD